MAHQQCVDFCAVVSVDDTDGVGDTVDVDDTGDVDDKDDIDDTSAENTRVYVHPVLQKYPNCKKVV